MLTQVRHGVTEALSLTTPIIVRSKLIVRRMSKTLLERCLLVYWKAFGVCQIYDDNIFKIHKIH